MSSFFLGAVFLLSFRYIINSPAIQLFIRRVNVAVRASALHLPSPERLEESDEKIRIRQWIEDNLLGGEETTDPKNLVLALTIFAATASLAMFGSVLPFSAKYDSACSAYRVVPYTYRFLTVLQHSQSLGEAYLLNQFAFSPSFA